MFQKNNEAVVSDTTASQKENSKENKDTNSSRINPEFINLNNISELDEKMEDVKQFKFKDFPVDALPKTAQEIIHQTNDCLGFPNDFVGSGMIHAAAVAIGNTYKSSLKWVESVNMYMAIVGNPGTVKSHVLHWLYSAFYLKDREVFEEYKLKCEAYEKAISSYSKKDKQDGVELPKKPVFLKSIVSDITIESLVAVLSYNRRGTCVLVDELAGWFNNMNRYSSGSDLEQWLSLFNGKPIIVDRKTTEPFYIPDPCVSVIGGIQPAIIEEMSKDNKGQNGFTHRILFVFPKGLKRQQWNTKELDTTITAKWFSIIHKLSSLKFKVDDNGKEVSNILRFTPDASNIIMQWQGSNALADEDYDNATVSGISAKIEIYVLRFALVLQLLRWACGEAERDAIDAESATNAIRIGEYFKAQGMEVAEYISNKNPIDRLPENKKNIYRSLPGQFKTADGLVIAENGGMPERTFEFWLKDAMLFQKIKHGEYKKIYP